MMIRCNLIIFQDGRWAWLPVFSLNYSNYYDRELIG